MLYKLSKIVPVPMKSCYTITRTNQPECATWWQWRGRIWKHERFAV